MSKPMRKMSKPRNIKQTVKRLIKYVGDYKVALIGVVFTIFVSAFATILGTFLLKNIINSIADKTVASDVRFHNLIKNVIVMASAYVVGAVATFSQQRIMLFICSSTLNKIRDDMFIKMEKLPIKYFDKRTHGEIMSLYTNDTDALREMISNGIPQLISSAITIIGVFTMMLILSPLLTLLVIGMLALMFFVASRLGSKSGKYFMKQQNALAKVNGYTEEYIEGQKVVKVFSRENIVNDGFYSINEGLFKASSKAQIYASILMPIMGNLNYLLYAMTAGIGGVLFVNSLIADVGTIAAFLQYTKQFSQPITQVANQFNSILMGVAGAERIFDLIDQEEEQDEGYVLLVNSIKDENGNIHESENYTGSWAWKHQHHDGTITYRELRGDVEFENVSFGYEEDKQVLNDISLYAHAGQKVALVGSTGAGKTTITNLINRFYDIDIGKIRYDDINIKKIKKPDLRRSLAMVLQDTHLFTGTVMENIRYGKLDATDEECIEAAKLANAYYFISHLPDGFNTMLSADGANLSQGQRQLIAIARAAVANPPVLILDEATSSIDTRTERLIEKGMDKLMEGRTVFVIAHRLSTVRNSDMILVMEHGKIIERGNHDELIAKQGKYYQLYTGMFELN